MKHFEFKLLKPKNVVMDYLTDTDKFVSVHPLVYKMKPVGPGKYKVYERVQFGPFPYYFTYFATLSLSPDRVRIDAEVMKITRISMVFELQEADGLTTVRETLHIQSYLPVKGFLQRLFESQHQILFAHIDAAVPQH